MDYQPINSTTICFMNSNRVWGGGEKWHYETACYLDEIGYSVLVVTNKNSELYHRLKGHSNISVIAKRITNVSCFNPFKLYFLKKQFRRHHVYAIILGLSKDMKLGGLAAKMAGMEHIIYRRGSAIPVKNSLLNRYLFHRVLTQIITNSREIKSNIFKKNPKIIEDERVRIIYNGINLQAWPDLDFFKKEADQQNVLILGNAGRLVEQKGQAYLISIAKILKEQGVAFKLFIAGTGKLEKSLKNKCKKKGLVNEVVFLDFIEDISAFLKSLDIYVSTSLHEGSSNVILEAMAAGKPVVAFDISSIPEIIIDGESGHLVPFGRVDLFAGKIMQLWNDKHELERFGHHARKLVETKFDFYKNTGQVLELIKKPV